MDILKRFNDAIKYLEANIRDEINMDELSQIACVTKDSFIRFFSYMSGMTLSEYIRRRRLSLAAYELRNSQIKVIDTAVKYGYNSADAFTKAFVKQHGILPTQARDWRQPIKIYPPVSFHMIIKGAEEMTFRMMETEPINLRGLSKDFSGDAAARFEQEHIMWALEQDEYLERVSVKIPGIWYGIWDNGTYWIAKPENEANTTATNPLTVPAGTYAVFTTECGGFAGDELPKLRELIFDSWLPDSGYTVANDYEIEVYHLCPNKEKGKRHYEIWIPIK